ncbi:30S ribosomal protein S8 [bacterium (Candidatus Gribaldobacteria) CG_4_10_14_0_8_um_filter_33_9]|uniref:Small ribosomal subunit protein uS8 n=1 Tax=bacterium (Candidatus Gribaldobacteria) CG_4_10_14_0_8_um_filter_33_9 TaxID=2014266 RepID=A0A2M7RN64_9BACT|nr:MAG: 30S ribosomal protein S8 [bacterium (Candidatus Gribaldobacteria) CG_4_10_14_0_8_um_filter_33_9]
MITDPLSDMLIRIKNALAVRHQTVEIPFSILKLKIIQIFTKEGFISDFKKLKRNNGRIIKVYLKYDAEGKPAIFGLKRISKIGKRVYKKAKEIKKVKAGYGMAIISTSKGIMSDKEAREQRQGGEILCEIW